MNIKFDYYYGTEAEQFSFYRIPKILFIDSKFKYISAEATAREKTEEKL